MTSSSSTTLPSVTTNCQDSSPVNLPYLPDDLLLNCLARVSRLDYPTLFLVSKRFRSLLASNSKELYKTRKLLGCTESCLYVCLLSESNPYWFILCRKPNTLPTLVSIPSEDYFPTYGWDVVTVGSNIYMIGGSNYSGDDNDEPSTKVFIMDCQSHTWCEALSMPVAHRNPSTSVLDGKIYVAGRIANIRYRWSSSMECFDPKTKKWEHVPSPKDEEIRPRDTYKSLAIKGKLYLVGEYENMLVYKPNDENRWDTIDLVMSFSRWNMERSPDSYCVLDNVLYTCRWNRYRYQTLFWYDFEGGIWRDLKGVEELPKFPENYYVRLVNFGGKLALLWEEDVSDLWGAIGSNEKMIWCAEISLERRNQQEIYGKVKWCEIVFRIPKSCYLDKCIAVTV